MNLRERYEELEEKILSPLATISKNSKGREKDEKKCDIRTDFQRDRDRIIHSKAFRRLKHKTQVFIAPEGDHYRTRLTHTLEVSQIARTISRAIRLNEDLTEAIALGHDLGHTPFGHTGEFALDKVTSNGFKHNYQSLRVVEYLEKGKGLNLTHEVKDGILSHSGELTAATNEGKVVKLADKIAYINHDIDDAIRAGILKNDDLPKECIKVLGKTNSERLNKMIMAVIMHAINYGEIKLIGEVGEATWELRRFMFENVYYGSEAKKEEDKAQNLVISLFEYYMKKPEEMPKEYNQRVIEFGLEQSVIDYIAGMTDRYAIHEFNRLFIPSPWQKYF
ncbi:Deoxyguanosinetriphosphate triphosphohydrolase [Caloramator mitchellensis]|uniref:Deoxyguanosinetriphosphate triphosphohydrolase-like protein n=1 Tax=Caloramator mitchellensis TaxID=908809 RepID=A0A0R3JT03_CALMK|nr:deoxyguanosinetriphosphate triphosphohydrolase [Caloramator mitchellensis]KRQ86640.1 Deoxyguanosinetriphosphate triphosphohydrolase [Caloramator mitchellensis]